VLKLLIAGDCVFWVGEGCLLVVKFACDAAADCLRFAQVKVVLHPDLSILWTSLMLQVGYGPLLLSASLDNILQPHRCRMMDSQYSPAAQFVRSMC